MLWQRIEKSCSKGSADRADVGLRHRFNLVKSRFQSGSSSFWREIFQGGNAWLSARGNEN
ncbi:MAG: hypothetical protein EB084_07535 [Proteobacteria bacterium]|nr:hypothetical protein [Pseudomonadota bacterium]